MNDDGSLSHDSLGPRALAIVTPFFVLAILIFSVRIYTRVTPTHKLDASDYTISIAILFEVVIYSLFAITVASGFGRHSYDVTPEQGVKILRYVYMVVLLTPFVPTLTRISVGCLLLKFARTTTWRAFIWFTICIQAACAIGTEVFQFLQCRPINAHWEEVPGARCFSAEQIWICGYVIVAAAMFGDLTLAVMPMFLIWKLSRSIVERCLLTFLMALGLVATTAVVMRVVIMHTFDYTSPEKYRDLIPMYFWIRMEEVILIIASSAPLLKSPIEHALHRFGVPTFQHRTWELNSFHSVHMSKAPRLRHHRSQQELLESRQNIAIHERRLEASEDSPRINPLTSKAGETGVSEVTEQVG